MRRIVIKLFILFQFHFNCQSQDTLDFNVQFHPETKYSQTILQSVETYLKFSGSDTFLKKIKENGQQNPVEKRIKSTIECVYLTDKLNDGANVPFTLEYLKTVSSDSQVEIPNGTLIYGQCWAGREPKLDSIVSKGLDQEVKNTILSNTQKNFSELFIPRKMLVVNDSFLVEFKRPIQLGPIPGDLTVLTSYRLIGISDGLGIFELTQVCSINSNNPNYMIIGKGGGKGNAIYSIQDNYYPKYQIDIDFKISVIFKNFKIEYNASNKFVQDTKISKK